jgi:hypothetical protein
VAWWALPQIIFLSVDFSYSFYPSAVMTQYQEAPLPTLPGPGWVAAIFVVSKLMMPVCAVLLPLLVLAGPIRVRRRPVPVRSPWRAAWIAISVVALAVEATFWVGVVASFSGIGASIYPDWLGPLPFAVAIAALAVAMIWVLPRAGVAYGLTPISDTNEPGLGGIVADP